MGGALPTARQAAQPVAMRPWPDIAEVRAFIGRRAAWRNAAAATLGLAGQCENSYALSCARQASR